MTVVLENVTRVVGAIPYILVSLFAGMYIDRWDRRRTLIGADLLRALTLVIVPLLLLRGFNLPLVIALAIVLPSFGRFSRPHNGPACRGWLGQMT